MTKNKIPFFLNSLLMIVIMLLMMNCNDTVETEIDVVMAAFEVSETEAFANDSITFTNTSENATYYIWDFGDGEVSTDENPSHSYSSAGTYEASLIAIGTSSSDTAKVNITVISNITIYEGVGIEGITVFASTWADVNEIYGDGIAEDYYSSEYDYYYYIVSYENEGISFFIYTGSSSSLYSDAVVFSISIWGSNYSGGTTLAGIGIGSTISEMKAAYGEPEDTETGTYSGYSYTYYYYDSKGIDFLDYDEDYIYQIDIFYPISETESTGINSKSARRIPGWKRKLFGTGK